MSDISIFDSNEVFVLWLVLFAPIMVFLILGFFFKSLGKPKAAKWFFFMTIGYVVIVLLLFFVLILSK